MADPVTVDDLEDGKIDIETLSNIVNLQEPTTETRLSGPVQTWFGLRRQFQDEADLVIANLGYYPPVPYSSGILIDDSHITVEYNGSIYAPTIESIPFTTSGSFESGSFRILEGVSSFELAATTGSSLVGYSALGAGAVYRTISEKSRDVINARDYGVVADGVTDDLPALNLAVEAVSQQGGGILYLPRGTIRISSTWVLGDGSDAQVSTKHHNLTIIGQGIGSHNSNDLVMQVGATEILYDGPAGDDFPVLSMEGPLHSMSLSGFTLNANSKAGIGINVNHVTDSKFDSISTKSVTLIGWMFTTRNGFPPACVYGCANNTIINCYNVVPANENVYGIQLTSGVDSSDSLTGNPDAANNDFIGGIYFYGGSSNSAGVYVGGADNNTMSGTQLIPSVSPSFGYSVFFNPWLGDTRFPLENVFTSLGASDPVGGVSGSLGNTFTIFQEGDGSDLPVMPYVNVFSHSGVEVIQGKRVWRTRDVSQATLVNTANDTTSASYVPIVPLTVTISDVMAGAKLRINCSANVGKLTAGSANFMIFVNTVAQSASKTTVPYNIQLQNTSTSLVIDAPLGGTYAVGLYFRSDDGNIARVADGVLTVEELY